MARVDLAERVHNHNYRLDPCVRSLLDTDFYKLLMCFFAWKLHPDVEVTFRVRNRSAAKSRLRDMIDEKELRAQLDHVRGLRFAEGELIWLQGNTFYGQRNIFPGEFIDFLRGLRLPDYRLGIGQDGDYDLAFRGRWAEVMLWEIYALSVLSELRARAGMADMSHYQLRVLYANATSKLVSKLKALRDAGVPRIAEFGTGAATGSSGRASPSRRCGRSWARTSWAPRTRCTPCGKASRRSARTRTSCRWCWRPCRA